MPFVAVYGRFVLDPRGRRPVSLYGDTIYLCGSVVETEGEAEELARASVAVALPNAVERQPVLPSTDN